MIGPHLHLADLGFGDIRWEEGVIILLGVDFGCCGGVGGLVGWWREEGGGDNDVGIAEGVGGCVFGYGGQEKGGGWG